MASGKACPGQTSPARGYALRKITFYRRRDCLATTIFQALFRQTLDFSGLGLVCATRTTILFIRFIAA